MPESLQQEVTITQAASILGVSESAVRMRLSRGSLKARPGEDGLLRVTLPPPGKRKRAYNTQRHAQQNITSHNERVTITQHNALPVDVIEELASLRTKVTEIEAERNYLRERLADAMKTIDRQAVAVAQQAQTALADQMGDMQNSSLLVQEAAAEILTDSPIIEVDPDTIQDYNVNELSANDTKQASNQEEGGAPVEVSVSCRETEKEILEPVKKVNFWARLFGRR